jgi:hypothetical protein
MVKESFKALVHRVGHMIEAVDAVCEAYPSMKNGYPTLVAAVVGKAISDETIAVHAASTKEEMVREHDAKLAEAIEKAANVAAAKVAAQLAAKEKAAEAATAKPKVVKKAKTGRK